MAFTTDAWSKCNRPLGQGEIVLQQESCWIRKEIAELFTLAASDEMLAAGSRVSCREVAEIIGCKRVILAFIPLFSVIHRAFYRSQLFTGQFRPSLCGSAVNHAILSFTARFCR
jgi:hypothetical protein